MENSTKIRFITLIVASLLSTVGFSQNKPVSCSSNTKLQNSTDLYEVKTMHKHIKPIKSTANNKGMNTTTSVNFVPLGQAGNAYSFLGNPRTYLWADNNINSVVFTHRMVVDPPGSYGTGRIAYDVSTNNGVASSWTNNIQVYNPTSTGSMYPDNFDTYNNGDLLAQVSSLWNTWDNNPGGPSDGYITDQQFLSDSNSLSIDESVLVSDLVYDLYQTTTGNWKVSLDILVPTGNYGGYFNIMQDMDLYGTTNEWGFHVYFRSNGTGYMEDAANNTTEFSYTVNTWTNVIVLINLDNNWAEFYIDNTLVNSWQWDIAGSNMLGVIDIFAQADGTDAAKYYIDNVGFTELLSADNAARYPQGGISNPAGNTDSSLATYAYFCPTLDGSNGGSWGGYGWGANNLTQTNPPSPTQHNTASTGNIYKEIPDAFTIKQNGDVWVANENWDLTAGNYTGSLIINKGVFNSSTNDIDYTEFLLPVLSSGDAINDTKIAFSPDGQTGYICVMSDAGYSIPYTNYHPIIRIPGT